MINLYAVYSVMFVLVWLFIAITRFIRTVGDKDYHPTWKVRMDNVIMAPLFPIAWLIGLLFVKQRILKGK
jgi:heme/copper-type cytochrome/quinol oxidase subunit 2